MPDQRVLPMVQPGYLRPLIPEDPPDNPEEWPHIQQDIDSKIKPGLTQWQSPNFMAYFPAAVSFPSILAELYSAAFNAPAFNWLCSPASTELEAIVMDWLAKALGLPSCFLSTSENHGGGVIQTSASDGVATMMVVARERLLKQTLLSEGLKEGTAEYTSRKMQIQPRLVAIASDQAHSSVAKGSLVAGSIFRSVPTRLDENMEMTGASLRRVLQQCEEDGLIPYHLTMTFGTTNTCSRDRIAEIKMVLQEKPLWKRIWVHIDAAYAGSALVAEEFRSINEHLKDGIDSFTTNPHKWLLINLDMR